MRSLPPDLQARLAALQQYKIKHSSLEKMDDLLKNAIDEHTSYGILALYGPSTTAALSREQSRREGFSGSVANKSSTMEMSY